MRVLVKIRRLIRSARPKLARFTGHFEEIGANPAAAETAIQNRQILCNWYIRAALRNSAIATQGLNRFVTGFLSLQRHL
jgi:hypothetical protein